MGRAPPTARCPRVPAGGRHVWRITPGTKAAPSPGLLDCRHVRYAPWGRRAAALPERFLTASR